MLTLVADRYTLCQQYLFKYTDEDQVIMWLAGHDLLEGKLHEPCFFGQDYNSCVEGYLATPLLAAGVPYHQAVPLVTVTLGLLPFLVLAWVAWRRRQSLVAATSLLVPILLPVRYAIITGMPRGFVPGVAFSIFPALLLLPPPPRPTRSTTSGEEPRLAENNKARWLRRSFPALRYFLAALLAALAIQLNPNCLILLVPVAVFALLTLWREWKFWVLGAAGLLTGLSYMLFVDQFYHVYHEDYVWYLRGKIYTWSWGNYNSYFQNFAAPTGSSSHSFSDLVPIHIAGANAPLFLVCAFAGVGLLLLLRLRVAGVMALLTGVFFTLLSFGYSRIADGRGGNPMTFSYSRMFLAIPVLFVWLLLLVNITRWPRFSNIPMTRWLTRGALVGMFIVGVMAVREKEEPAALQRLIANEVGSANICQPELVEDVYASAAEVQKAADIEDADLVVFGYAEKILGYSLPCITTVDTLLASPQERRTWRFIEELEKGRHEKILLVSIPGGTPVGLSAQANPPEPPPSAIDRLLSPLTGRGRGGGGGRGAGRGAAAGRAPAPRSAARGKSAAPAVRASMRGYNRAVSLPGISVISTKGKSVIEILRSLGAGLPPITTPPVTRANPTPKPIVYRSNWNR
jgi:hypothetical protein